MVGVRQQQVLQVNLVHSIELMISSAHLAERQRRNFKQATQKTHYLEQFGEMDRTKGHLLSAMD